MQRSAGEKEKKDTSSTVTDSSKDKTVKPSTLGCLVKTHNCVKNLMGKLWTLEKENILQRKRNKKETCFYHLPRTSPKASPRSLANSVAASQANS